MSTLNHILKITSSSNKLTLAQVEGFCAKARELGADAETGIRAENRMGGFVELRATLPMPEPAPKPERRRCHCTRFGGNCIIVPRDGEELCRVCQDNPTCRWRHRDGEELCRVCQDNPTCRWRHR